MTNETYISYYTPLIQEFIQQIRNLQHPDIAGIPEPHLPLFGPRYHSSALRLAIIGQDTYGWGDLRDFAAAETEEPGCKLRQRLAEFRDRRFVQWGNKRQTFWGFAMMFLATFHGQENWGLMKQGKMTEILDSFAWAEGNAIELYGSSARGLGVPPDYWHSVREAGERFDRFRHVAETLKPHVAIILYRGLNKERYFEGYTVNEVSRDGRLVHYHLPEIGTDVIHAPHPGSMNRIEGTDAFIAKFRELFQRHQIMVPFPEFLTSNEEGKHVMAHLEKVIPAVGPQIDKYEFVARVADELAKRDAFMSVPALMELVNSKGGRTNYGEPFSGVRGSYRLVSGTYHRMTRAGSPDRAHSVAVSFRRPNFEYAYSDE